MGRAWILQSCVSSLNISNCTKLNWQYLASTWITVHDSCKWLSHLVFYSTLWNLCDIMLVSVLLSQVWATCKWHSSLSITIHVWNVVFQRKAIFITFSKLGAAQYRNRAQAGHPGFGSQQEQHIFLHSIVSTLTLAPTQPPTQYTRGNSGSTRYVLMTVHN
jgi:hypothetical protein